MQADARAIPFRDICDKAKPVLESLCRRWLPQGHRSGAWWVTSCPWRQDKKASLMVSLTTGHWEDRGGAISGKEKGDVIKLCSILHSVDMVDAADAVARIVGHDWRKGRR
jgi:CHC2 zinc finger